MKKDSTDDPIMITILEDSTDDPIMITILEDSTDDPIMITILEDSTDDPISGIIMITILILRKDSHPILMPLQLKSYPGLKASALHYACLMQREGTIVPHTLYLSCFHLSHAARR